MDMRRLTEQKDNFCSAYLAQNIYIYIYIFYQFKNKILGEKENNLAGLYVYEIYPLNAIYP